MSPRWKKNPLFQQQGFSILEILIFSGIALIVSTAMMGLHISMSKENRALQEKIGTLEILRTINSALTGSGICQKLVEKENLHQAGDLPFDSRNSNIFPYKVSLLSIKSASGAVLVSAGDVASPLIESLKIAKANAEQPGIELVIDSVVPPSAKIIVRFDPKGLIRTLKPLEFDLYFVTFAGPAEKINLTSWRSGRGM